MRHNLAVFVICACAVLAVAAGSARAVSVSLVPSTPGILAGETVNVDVMVSGLESVNVAGFLLEVGFDPAILSAQSHLLDVHLGVVPVDAQDLSFGPVGTDRYSVAEVSLLSDLSSQPSAFRLATISFKGIGEGYTAITPTGVFLFEDPAGAPIQGVLAQGTGVEVGPAVPEPLTVLGVLGGLAVAGFAARRRIETTSRAA